MRKTVKNKVNLVRKKKSIKNQKKMRSMKTRKRMLKGKGKDINIYKPKTILDMEDKVTLSQKGLNPKAKVFIPNTRKIKNTESILDMEDKVTLSQKGLNPNAKVFVSKKGLNPNAKVFVPKTRKAKKFVGGYTNPSDVDSVRLSLRSKLPGVLANRIAVQGREQPRLPSNLVNELVPAATNIQSKYSKYADQLQFNRDSLKRAKARFPERFLPGALPFPVRQSGYNWMPKGEIDDSGNPVYPGEDRFAREYK